MVRFTTKKIDTLTLGERMKKLRTDRRLSLAEMSKGTRIQAKYLEYLEEGEYLKLPADVYVKGFLRSYAIFMGLNEQSLIKQYEREKGIHRNIKKISNDDVARSPLKFSTVVVTPKMVVVSSVLLLVFGSFFYLYSEVNSFISTPRLVIIKPLDGLSVDGSATHVAGFAEKDALVFINDQPVLVNEKGEFSEDIGLKEGLNMITVKARSKFNKESQQSVSVSAHFANSAEQNSEGEQSSQTDPVVLDESAKNSAPVSAEVYVTPNPTWISIEADGNLVYSGVLLPDSVQKFEAKQMVSVTSGKGNGTFVKINGKDMGTASNDSGVVRDVEYTSQGRVIDTKKN